MRNRGKFGSGGVGAAWPLGKGCKSYLSKSMSYSARYAPRRCESNQHAPGFRRKLNAPSWTRPDRPSSSNSCRTTHNPCSLTVVSSPGARQHDKPKERAKLHPLSAEEENPKILRFDVPVLVVEAPKFVRRGKGGVEGSYALRMYAARSPDGIDPAITSRAFPPQVRSARASDEGVRRRRAVWRASEKGKA